MKEKRKKGWRGRARELIGVNWLLLFWPKAEKKDKSQDKRKKVCVLGMGGVNRKKGERLAGEVKGFQLAQQKGGQGWGGGKTESWQVHTHCATHISHLFNSSMFYPQLQVWITASRLETEHRAAREEWWRVETMWNVKTRKEVCDTLKQKGARKCWERVGTLRWVFWRGCNECTPTSLML